MMMFDKAILSATCLSFRDGLHERLERVTSCAMATIVARQVPDIVAESKIAIKSDVYKSCTARYAMITWFSFPSFRRSTASSGNEDGIIEVKCLSCLKVLG